MSKQDLKNEYVKQLSSDTTIKRLIDFILGSIIE